MRKSRFFVFGWSVAVRGAVMKNERRFLLGVLIALLTVCLSFPALAETKGVPLDDLPPAVQKTIKSHLQGGVIQEIELATEKERKVYEVEILKDGQEIEFLVSSDGKYLGRAREEMEEDAENEAGAEEDEDEKEEYEDAANEEKIALSDAPEKVREAVKKIIGKNPLKQMERETEDGVVIYEAEYVAEGVVHSVGLSENGDVLEIEIQMAPDKLPPAVARALEAKYGKIEIGVAESIQMFSYEVKFPDGAEKREVKLDAAGRILEQETGGEEEGEEEEEEAITLNDAPQPVQKAVRKIIGDRELKQMEREKKGDAYVYEVEYVVDGATHSVGLNAAGDTLEIEIEIAPDSLPAAVKKALKAKFPDAGSIEIAESIQSFFYEVKFRSDEKMHEVKLDPSGQILEAE